MDLNQMFPECVVNINGNITSPQDARISVFDRGFLYGDSIYEVTYSDDRCLLFFDEHLQRLFNSARLLDMQLYLDQDKIVQETLRTLKSSNIDRAYIRIVLTRGETPIGLDPTISTGNNLVIIVKPQPPYPQAMYQKGLHLTIASVHRNDIKATNPNAKSGNYLNNVMAMNEAKKAGADDAIMVNHEGQVAEGTTFNIWMIKNNKILTPPAKSGLLKGITRGKVLDICQQHGLDYAESIITPEQILDADEVFITSSTKGIVPVAKLDQRTYPVGEGKNPVTNTLSKIYNQLVMDYKNQKKYTY